MYQLKCSVYVSDECDLLKNFLDLDHILESDHYMYL